MFVVYVLVNERGDRTYVGQTEDLEERLRVHNLGYVRSTERFGPWRVLHQESVGSRGEAMKRETYYKSAVGRRHIAKMLMERCPSG